MSDETKPLLDPQSAREALAAEAKARIDACAAEINSVLEKNRCVLDISVVVSARGCQPQLNILPKE